ncbi:MAG: GNAT family N-acetyltransferase [Planctomycetota bacterium]|nr:GNAT family N-acetyltransferase [Planctomycetota bacterium]
MLIFLDIDGVLRRESGPRYRFEPQLRDIFEECIRPHEKLRIVISSTWRLGFLLHEIKAHFSQDIRNRVIGITPTLRQDQQHRRHREVLAYLKRHEIKEPWIAIDDSDFHYPSLPNLLLTESESGFDTNAAAKFMAMVQELDFNNEENSKPMNEHPDFRLQKVEKRQLKPEQIQGFFVGWPNPPSPATHVRILERSFLSLVIIEEASEKVVAFVNCISDGVLTCYIPLLEVLPEFQGRGFGSTLIESLKNECKDFYMIDILCDSEILPFYGQLGFQKSTGALRRNYNAQSGRPNH